METSFPDPPQDIGNLRIGLLSFYFGNENLYSVLWSYWGAVEVTKLMSCAEVCSLVDDFQQAIDPYCCRTSRAAAFNRFIYEWGPQLVPHAGILADYHVLTIIPHRLLHGLPFHAIWSDHNERHLGTTHGISYCSSATLLLHCAGRNARRLFPPERDPHTVCFSTSCIPVAADVAGEQSDSFRAIAVEFARYFPEASSTFSTRLFKYQAAQSPFAPICIVCHGFNDAERPTASGLMLDPIVPGVDGFSSKRFVFSGMRPSDVSVVEDAVFERRIFVDEKCDFLFRDLPFRASPIEFESAGPSEAMTVDELNIDVETSASLVALFACHSGAGNESIGDDFTSYAYQWLKVGAASVLANNWQADVDFVKDFSSRFMHYWMGEGRAKAIAFRLALADFIRDNPSASLEKWGVISLFGDWL